MRYVNTKHQIADFNTKAITKAETWWHLLRLAQIRLPDGDPGDPGGSQANRKIARGKTDKSTVQQQSATTAACVGATTDDRRYECKGCDGFHGNVYCCPIRIKKDSSSSRVEEHDDPSNGECYFECEEPSKVASEHTSMRAQVRFERSLVVLFRATCALMLVPLAIAALAMQIGWPRLTPAQAMQATNDARAYLSGGQAEASHIHTARRTPSDSDESAKTRLFGMFAGAVCPDAQPGELQWHYWTKTGSIMDRTRNTGCVNGGSKENAYCRTRWSEFLL